MERVIVSLSQRGEEKELDLDVPVDTPLGALVQEIALALGWDTRSEIYADPPGRVLHPTETLAQAGVGDGARLFFQGQGSYAGPPAPPPSPPPSPGGEGPVQGWRPLDLGQPPTSSSPHPFDAESPSPSGGFVWKQIDED